MLGLGALILTSTYNLLLYYIRYLRYPLYKDDAVVQTVFSEVEQAVVQAVDSVVEQAVELVGVPVVAQAVVLASAHAGISGWTRQAGISGWKWQAGISGMEDADGQASRRLGRRTTSQGRR